MPQLIDAQTLIKALGPMQEELNISAVSADAQASSFNAEQGPNFERGNQAHVTLGADVIAPSVDQDMNAALQMNTEFNGPS